MNTNKLPLYIGLGVLAILLIWAISSYNGLVTASNDVNLKWSNVQTAYQRRTDLIPNLVKTVKGYADFEKSTLTAVIDARAKATAINISGDNLTPENLKNFQQAQAGVTGALNKLMVVAEAYPNLKASEGFLNFQAQLEGTENRIKQERDLFNKSVNDYNNKVMRFPGNIMAGIFGYSAKSGFQAEPGSEKAPEVNF